MTRSSQIDARALLARGEDPLATVLESAAAIVPGGVLVVEAPFDPLPMRRVLAGRGFSSQAERLAQGHWRITFHRDGRGMLSGGGGAEACPGDASTPVWVEQDVLHIDVRGMAPPAPMLAILRLIGSLEPPRPLIVHHEREPLFLYPELAELGWSWQTLPAPGGEVRLRLDPPGEAEQGRAR